MFVLASSIWFSRLIRQFFYSVDKIVYNFIPTIYDLLISIARTSVLSQGDIASIADRIYKLLAVFMIFKVTFSLIMYVVNPDDFSDKNKGVGKLSTNIIISLALLVLTPYIFRYAYQLQTIILEDNSLGTLIFGSESDENILNTAGDNMAYITISPFFTPNVSLIELYECSELVDKDSTGSIHFNESCSGVSSTDYDNLEDDSSLYSLLDDNFKESDLKNYVAGVEANSMPLMFRQNMVTATTTKSSGTNGQEFIMDYKWGFSTVIGIVIVLLLITFCMDVALRSIKLSFLQLVAPIPIISLVDPKSGKDGLFKKWYDMCFKTFLSLFIRILALYFAVYIIGKVADLKMVDIIDGSYISNRLIAIFIIVGALMFVKQFPKILEGMGIKLDGGFTLNPLKKMENEMIGGKQVSKFAKAAPAAGLAGAAAFGTNLIARKGNVFSAAAGAVSATTKGLKGAIKGEKFGKNFANSYGGAMQARINRADRKELGINAFDVAKENFKSALYIPNEAQKNKATLDHLKAYASSGKTAKSRAEGEVDKKANMIEVDGENLGALRDSYEILKNTQISRNVGESDAHYQNRVEQHAKLAAEANAKYFKARKKAVNAYVKNADKLDESSISIGGSTVTGFDSAFTGAAAHDEIVVSNIEKMKQLNSDHGMGQNVKAEDIGDSIQRAEDATAKIEGSREYRQAELIAEQAKKEKSNKQ